MSKPETTPGFWRSPADLVLCIVTLRAAADRLPETDIRRAALLHGIDVLTKEETRLIAERDARYARPTIDLCPHRERPHGPETDEVTGK